MKLTAKVNHHRPGHCGLCQKLLDPDRAVWLTCDTRGGYTDGKVPEEFDQGGFEFGPDCAKKICREYDKQRATK